jgi:hypothetical protein
MTGVWRGRFRGGAVRGSLVPVHARHLAIHQDQRVVETLQGRAGFLAVGHDISIEAAMLQVGIPMTQPDVSSEVMWGGRPRRRGGPCLRVRQRDGGVPRGPGGPPHEGGVSAKG